MYTEAIEAWAKDLREVGAMLRATAGEKAVRNHFRMTTWAKKLPEWEEPDIECGFAGCALGWAAHREVFTPYGFEVKTQVADRADLVGAIMIDGDVTLFPDYALTKHLQLSNLETIRHIVFPEFYPQDRPIIPEDVADRLDFLLAHGEKEFLRRYVTIGEDDELAFDDADNDDVAEEVLS